MKEINIEGIYFSPFVLHLILAGAVFLPVRTYAYRRWIDAHVWHPALFELAVFIVLLTIISLIL
jgi:protein AaeX